MSTLTLENVTYKYKNAQRDAVSNFSGVSSVSADDGHGKCLLPYGIVRRKPERCKTQGSGIA